MVSKVQKRPQTINGQIVQKTVDFDPSKITSAIYRAAYAVGGRDYDKAVELTKKVIERIEDNREYITVEEIQDIVEEVLVDNGHYKTAKAYILYRHQHAQARNADIVKSQEHILTYLSKNDLAVKENANMAFSLQGLNVFVAEQICENFWLEKIYPEFIRNAAISGDIHIHDLGILAPYCVGWDLKDLLMEGFTGVPGKISSAPPKHFRTALGQAVNFIYTIQGEAAGAQAFSNFDTLLAPFIWYDNLDYQQVKQGLQEFIFNMNVPTRVGFQSPFSNITLDLKVPKYMEYEPVIIGGKFMDKTYGEFQEQMNMFNRAFAEVMCEGDAKGRVFTFPIPTYNITEEFDWDNPIYNGIWEMTARYGIPYFANYVNSDMNPEDARSMCCRLRIDNKEIRRRMGGLFAASPLTGSIGVVTINMPRIGYLTDSKEEFLARLGMMMDIAKDSLEIKRKTLESWTNEGLYPYIRFYLRGVKAKWVLIGPTTFQQLVL
ncbi:ribonucleoside triphosphate reductase [Syntrophomonas palmitatica]|uniref:ribonucleoside triphosphate reductase n=1 Tax=Syntrophomonas palmitatica TaxID=402877 RepID=UPI000AD1BC42